jgi:uncharacterized phiE125 gp8 family phage protein
MPLTVITPPSAEGFLFSEAKAHLNITDNADDDLITSLVSAAREIVEGQLGQPVLATVFDLFADAFPRHGCALEVPGPVLSVDSVNYLPADGGAETELPTDNFVTDVASNPARLAPATPAGWPATASSLNAVRVRFTGGYGDTADEVPAAIRHAILMTVAHLYENREATAVGVSAAILPFGVDAILANFRTWSL